jgi:hypothetical protein
MISSEKSACSIAHYIVKVPNTDRIVDDTVGAGDSGALGFAGSASRSSRERRPAVVIISGSTVCRREANRKFADLPLEGARFEPSVPRQKDLYKHPGLPSIASAGGADRRENGEITDLAVMRVFVTGQTLHVNGGSYAKKMRLKKLRPLRLRPLNSATGSLLNSPKRSVA